MLPFELTKDTPYLALSGELWSVFYEYFKEIDRAIKGFHAIHVFIQRKALQWGAIVTRSIFSKILTIDTHG